MRRHAPHRPIPRPARPVPHHLATIRSLLPYLWPRGDRERACPRRAGRRLPGAGQGGDRLYPAGLQPRRRRPVPEAPPGHGAGRAHPRLRPAARRLRRLRRAAGRRVRRRAAAHDPPGGAAHVPAHAQPVDALPPGPADRRRVPLHRARRAGIAAGAAPGRVQPAADAVRGAARHQHHLDAVRLALRPGHLRRGGQLHRLHHRLHHLAGEIPPPDERGRQRGEHQGARQPAELRDGEVFRQRGPRGPPFRRGAGPLRDARPCAPRSR